MSDHDPIQRNLSTPQSRELHCEAWQCLLPEALDGTLSAAESAAFEKHGQGCAACAQMLKEGREGAAWLSFLEEPPEMPTGLLDKILFHTSGAERAQVASPGRIAIPSPPVWSGGGMPMGRRVLGMRTLRTAAMAFFSLALTLNLIGVKLSEVRLSDLRPAALRTQLTRQYYSVNAQVVRYYENLRFVYEMEAGVRELRRSAEPAPVETPFPTSRNGGASRKMPKLDSGGLLQARRESRFPGSAPVESTAMVNEFADGRHGSGEIPTTQARAERSLA